MLHPLRPQALQIPCHHHHLPLATHQAMAAASTLATCKSTTATPSWHTRPTSMLCHHGMQDPPQHQHTTMPTQHRDPTTTPSSTQYARPGLRQMTTMTVMGMVVVGDSVTARHPYFSDCTYFIYAINRLFFV